MKEKACVHMGMHTHTHTHTHTPVSWMLRRMKPAAHLRMKVLEDKLSRGGVGLGSNSRADVPRFPERLEALSWRASVSENLRWAREGQTP